MTVTRRTGISLFGSASIGAWLLAKESLAPGTPASAERMALINSFRKRSAGLDKKFEKRSHKSDWVMPYRLFRPASREKLPLVLYRQRKAIGPRQHLRHAELVASRESRALSLLCARAADRPRLAEHAAVELSRR